MFNSSLRCVARTRPTGSLSSRSTPNTSHNTIASATFSTHRHQRRYSSSKPPVPPNDGSHTIPATSVKQVGAPRSTDKRPGAESRLSKRKTAKGEKVEPPKQMPELRGNEWTASLPSVPSTQYLNPKDVYVASFFSTHRPISISGPLPPETALEAFDKIFEARPKRSRKTGTADVIYTLNNVVQNLDEHIQGQQQEGGVEQRADLIKALTQHNAGANPQNSAHHLDGQPMRAPGNMKMVIEEIAKRFRPFNTPPPPVPMADVDFQAKEESAGRIHKSASDAQNQPELNEELQARALELEIESQHQPFTSRQPQSVNHFFTPKTPITNPRTTNNITDPSTSQATHTGRLRKGVYVDPSESQGVKYYTISVKRQRKLKMKKHKYKKLMRKTRNLRRRQDKL